MVVAVWRVRWYQLWVVPLLCELKLFLSDSFRYLCWDLDFFPDWKFNGQVPDRSYVRAEDQQCVFLIGDTTTPLSIQCSFHFSFDYVVINLKPDYVRCLKLCYAVSHCYSSSEDDEIHAKMSGSSSLTS